jgi:hypothetical protein
MSSFGGYDGDDFKVKGDDGSIDGKKIGAVGDRLKVDAAISETLSDVTIIDPQTGAESLVAPNGVLHIAGLVRLVGDNFVENRPLLDNIWNEVDVNGGATQVIDGELDLNTGVGVDGEVRLETVRVARFITGTFNISHQAIACPDENNTNVCREWGCYDPASGTQNGVLWKNDGGAWSLERYKNSVLIESVPEASFNNAATNLLVKNGNIHIYEIMYNAGVIFFLQDRKLLHKMGSAVSAAYGTPHLKCGLRIYNKNGNAVNNKIITRGLSIGRLGSSDSIPSFLYINTSDVHVIKNTPGKLFRLIVGDRGTASSSLEIYDGSYDGVNITGRLIAEIDTQNINNDLIYEIEFDEGLVIETGGGQIKVTVVYD